MSETGTWAVDKADLSEKISRLEAQVVALQGELSSVTTSREIVRTELGAARDELIEVREALRLALREKDDFRANIIEVLHEEADSRGWCEEFDDLMEQHGLPRRTREVDIQVEATLTVRFTLTLESSRSADETASDLSRRDVKEWLEGNNLDDAADWSIDEFTAESR